jgi:hypothetical protein
MGRGRYAAWQKEGAKGKKAADVKIMAIGCQAAAITGLKNLQNQEATNKIAFHGVLIVV